MNTIKQLITKALRYLNSNKIIPKYLLRSITRSNPRVGKVIKLLNATKRLED